MLANTKNTAIFSKEWGKPGNADAFLFLHGIESHAGWFDSVADRLVTQGLWTRAYDRPGWGQSEGKRGHMPDVDTALDEVMRQVRQLRDRGAARIHLIGQSWGAMVAIAVSEMAKDKIFRMTLISPGVYPTIGRSLGIAGRAFGEVLRGGLHPSSISLGMNPQSFSPVRASQQWIHSDELRVTAISCQTLWTTLRLQRRVGFLMPRQAFAIPTQVLIGSEDVMIARDRTIRFARLRGGHVEVVPGAGHALVLDAPQIIADSLLRFHESHI